MNVELETWFDLNGRILNSSLSNDDVKRIIQNNKDLKQQIEFCGEHEFFTEAIKNMIGLSQKVFGAKEFSSVLRIVMEFSKLTQSMSPTNYTNSIKIFMQMLKTNEDLLSQNSSIQEYPISSLCKMFCSSFKNVHENSDNNQHFKLARIQLRLITEIRKLFGDEFRGSSHLLEAIIDLQRYQSDNELNDELQNLLSNLKKALWNELNSSNLYASFFTPFHDQSDSQFVLELSAEVMDKMSENEEFLRTALPNDRNSNFCLLIIEFLAKNPQIIQNHAELYTSIVLKIAQLLCNKNLSSESFKFIERELVKAMMNSDNFWTGEISFLILLEFLGEIESTEVIADYFLVFQKLLKKIWNPSTNISVRAQLYIVNIVRFIMRKYSMIVQPNVIDSEIADVIMEVSKQDSQQSFTNSFETLIAAPTVENYYKLILSLKMLSFCDIEFGQETIAKFCELIKMTESCDWSLNCGLIICIIQAIISTDNMQHKMIFLLKLSTALRIEKTKPFELKFVIVKLLFSLIHLGELQQGLPGLVSRELNRLINGPETDVLIVRIIKEHLNSGDEIPWKIIESLKIEVDLVEDTFFDEEEHCMEILESSIKTKSTHKCPKINHNQPPLTSVNSRRLQMILDYSQSIDNQQLTDHELQLCQQIYANFERIIAKPINGLKH